MLSAVFTSAQGLQREPSLYFGPAPAALAQVDSQTARIEMLLPPGTRRRVPSESRVGKGISAQASHRTVREALTSYGSCYPINILFLIASDRTCLPVELVFLCT